MKHKLINKVFIKYLFVGISIVFMVFVPSLLWVLSGSTVSRWDSFQSVSASLGELAGILGAVLFSFSLILTARSNAIEKKFGGLNEIYERHSHIGQVAFMLLLIHPILLLTRYADNIKDAKAFFVFGESLQQNLGILSLLLMIITIILTLYLRPRYDIWKQVHKIFGVALFIGALHIYFSPSYVLRHNIFLTVYVLGIATLAIVVFVYRSIFSRSFANKYTYTVSQVQKVNNSVIEIEMMPKTERDKILFNSGQFVFVDFVQEGFSKESHPFSIVSTNEEISLKIAVKVLGDYTADLYNNLNEFTIANIEGPFGVFSHVNKKRGKQIWIAGGIGITPFVSMAKSLLKDSPYNIDLYYVVKNESEAVYASVLEKIASQINGFNLTVFYSDEGGLITAKNIVNNVSDFLDRDILFCAPSGMIHALKEQFISLGVQKRHLYSEEFNF